MQYYPFDSQNLIYRSKIGAAAAGETLVLRLLLHHDAHCHDAFLRLHSGDPDGTRETPLKRNGDVEDYSVYEITLIPETGVFWYSFHYTSDFGEFFVMKTDTSLGVVTDGSGSWWQQTVYQADFSTPKWLQGGLIYQIFPDRFYASHTPKQNVPTDRFLCSNWNSQPEFQQTDSKRRLGNDYYGGDLRGIIEKLPYLRNLGVTCLYLNPIFEAHSNHRYNTADYFKIDPLLGTAEDLKHLCQSADKLGIAVMLDGVFSHTGDDSVYFNRKGRYGNNGAYQKIDSPFHSWYCFQHFPDDYSAWWGIQTLPETNEEDPGFSEFITGENGVLRFWMRQGVKGWRLDVADELPDSFLKKIRTAVKTENPDAFLLGEVWEDASNKISYGVRRKFLLGEELDSVMNYPFANAIVDFVRKGNAEQLNETVMDLCENYPLPAINCLMNHIGTHDTVRILTRLMQPEEVGDREWQSHQLLSVDDYREALKRLRLAVAIQYTLPGIPSVFYGDEVGVQGYGDPFCRAPFPWGNEDNDLLRFYQAMGKLRKECSAFADGDYVPLCAENQFFAFERRGTAQQALVAVNRSDSPQDLALPPDFITKETVFGNPPTQKNLCVEPWSFAVLIASAQKPKGQKDSVLTNPNV